MRQILHGSTKTTHVVRAAIQRSKATTKALAEQYDINHKIVPKWLKRNSITIIVAPLAHTGFQTVGFLKLLPLIAGELTALAK